MPDESIWLSSLLPQILSSCVHEFNRPKYQNDFLEKQKYRYIFSSIYHKHILL